MRRRRPATPAARLRSTSSGKHAIAGDPSTGEHRRGGVEMIVTDPQLVRRPRAPSARDGARVPDRIPQIGHARPRSLWRYHDERPSRRCRCAGPVLPDLCRRRRAGTRLVCPRTRCRTDSTNQRSIAVAPRLAPRPTVQGAYQPASRSRSASITEALWRSAITPRSRSDSPTGPPTIRSHAPIVTSTPPMPAAIAVHHVADGERADGSRRLHVAPIGAAALDHSQPPRPRP